jgi:hypothetical protein
MNRDHRDEKRNDDGVSSQLVNKLNNVNGLKRDSFLDRAVGAVASELQALNMISPSKSKRKSPFCRNERQVMSVMSQYPDIMFACIDSEKVASTNI